MRPCAAEHGEGRALDWMLNAHNAQQLALGNSITRWLSAPDSRGRAGAMARRFGINYIIWNRQMWRAYAPERGWAPYSGASPHTDHIHISFTWDGAYGRTSWWTGVAVTTPLTGPVSGPVAPITVIGDTRPTVTLTGYPVLRQGSRGSDVTLVQRALRIGADGVFGPATAAAVGRFQQSSRLRVTRVVDDATWRALVTRGLVPNKLTSRSTLGRYAGTTLRVGSRGAAVKALQTALSRELTADGVYGPATADKVRYFQQRRGLRVTGVFTPTDWKVLMGGSVAKAPTTAKPTKPTAPAYTAPTRAEQTRYAGTTLRSGSRGAAVSVLQRSLSRNLAADGAFGPATLAKVRLFQQQRGLRVTGIWTPTEWRTLLAGKTATPKPTPGVQVATTTTEFTPYKSTVLRQGARGNAVRLLQRSLGGLSVDGVFGSRSTAAVKSFQAAQRIPATGVVDSTTWARLEARAHPLLPYWGTVMRSGSRGTAVVALQRALGITADGAFGPATERAVKAAQAKARIAQTGVVATVTWKAIEAQSRR